MQQNAGILLRFVDLIDRIVASHNFLLPPILHLGFRVPPRVRSERVEGHGFGRAEDELQFTLSVLIKEANSLPCSATGRLVWGQVNLTRGECMCVAVQDSASKPHRL